MGCFFLFKFYDLNGISFSVLSRAIFAMYKFNCQLKKTWNSSLFNIKIEKHQRDTNNLQNNKVI